MDVTIQNLDEQAYRKLQASAMLEGRTVGDLISEAIRGYLARSANAQKRGTLRDLMPEPFPEGNDRLSSEVDLIVYGQR